MLSTTSAIKQVPVTPNRTVMAKAKMVASGAIPSVTIGDEAYSVFGENGDSIIEDLMRTDDSIMNIISESNGAMETLLGSVFSPAQVPGLASPHVSAVLMSPAGGYIASASPRASPRNFYSLAWSPHPTTTDSVRRSARITPTRGLFFRDDSMFDETLTPRTGAIHGTAATMQRATPSSRKTLSMGGSAGADFEDYVLAPISPFTPHDNTNKDMVGGKTKLAFPSEMKGDASKSSSKSKQSASGSKRGEYKCGKCGFFPKKEKHDCNAFKKKCLQQGIEIQTRNRKGGGSKKKKPKTKACKTSAAAQKPILATLPTAQKDAALNMALSDINLMQSV